MLTKVKARVRGYIGNEIFWYLGGFMLVIGLLGYCIGRWLITMFPTRAIFGTFDMYTSGIVLAYVFVANVAPAVWDKWSKRNHSSDDHFDHGAFIKS